MQDDRFYFPTNIYIEITNHCNVKCRICPHGSDLIEKKGYMKYEVFKKIIDDISDVRLNIQRIGLYGLGESLLHPDFAEMAFYGKSKGFFQQLTTNALFLSPDKSREIIQQNLLDYLEISFDDDVEKYSYFKGGDIYDMVLDNIKYFVTNNRSTDVRIMFCQYDMDKDNYSARERFKKQFRGKNVTFVSHEVWNWRGTMQMDFLTEKVRKKMLRKRNEVPQKTKCTNGADMGMFQWDGQLRSCYMDYNGENTYGNIIENNAIDLFLNKNRRLFIDNIVNGNHKLNYVCKDCLSPYNIRTNELLLERPDGKQISLQGNNWDSVKCSPEWDKVK